MLNATLDAIYQYLKKNNYNPQMQQETKQVYVTLRADAKEFPLFFRFYDEGHLLQMIVFIPCPLNQQILGDMGRLLHILNKELDIPGFGMDEAAGVIFYRFMLPTPNKKFEEMVLTAFIKTFEQVCSTFTTPIQAVAYGATSLEEILTKARKPQDK